MGWGWVGLEGWLGVEGGGGGGGVGLSAENGAGNQETPRAVSLS